MSDTNRKECYLCKVFKVVSIFCIGVIVGIFLAYLNIDGGLEEAMRIEYIW